MMVYTVVWTLFRLSVVGGITISKVKEKAKKKHTFPAVVAVAIEYCRILVHNC